MFDRDIILYILPGMGFGISALCLIRYIFEKCKKKKVIVRPPGEVLVTGILSTAAMSLAVCSLTAGQGSFREIVFFSGLELLGVTLIFVYYSWSLVLDENGFIRKRFGIKIRKYGYLQVNGIKQTGSLILETDDGNIKIWNRCVHLDDLLAEVNVSRGTAGLTELSLHDAEVSGTIFHCDIREIVVDIRNLTIVILIYIILSVVLVWRWMDGPTPFADLAELTIHTTKLSVQEEDLVIKCREFQAELVSRHIYS